MSINRGTEKEDVGCVCVCVYIYIMGYYYSTIKRNESGSFVEMWMGLESIIQSEVSQKQ